MIFFVPISLKVKNNSTRYFFWGLLFFICSFFQSCIGHNETSATMFYILTGTVVDISNGKPVKDARIAVYAESSNMETEERTKEVACYSDKNGKFYVKLNSAEVSGTAFPIYFVFHISHSQYKREYYSSHSTNNKINLQPN